MTSIVRVSIRGSSKSWILDRTKGLRNRRASDAARHPPKRVGRARGASRVHQTLRVTPAMAAGLTDHVWDLAELVALVPKPVARPWGSVKRAAAVQV
jgi:hypothetical protein